jgi:histidyl-tRNA synthetase
LERFELDARAMRFLLNHRVMLKEYGKAAVLTALDRYLSIEAAQSVLVAEVSTEALSAMLPSRITTMGGRSREDIARRLLEKQQRHANRSQIVAALDFLVQWDALQAPVETAFDQISEILSGDQRSLKILAEWRATLDLVNAYAIPLGRVTLQPDLVRNWDYYTGIVFELHVPSASPPHTAVRVVGGGGRYDELTHLIGSTDHTPAVGFTYYADTLTQLLHEAAPSHNQPITLADQGAMSIRWAQRLREQGVNIVLVSPDTAQEITLWVTDDDNILLNNDTYTSDDLARLTTDLEGLR